MSLAEVRYLLTILVIFFLPGWAFLGVTRAFKSWAPFQRWCLAGGIGIAFYPILFYFLRVLLPQFRLGSLKIIALLLVFALLVVFTYRKNWREQISFDRTEWIAVFTTLATVVTRVWMAHLYPYPAWSDSLHHTLLTELTAAQGKLPISLEPYAPTVTSMYHLGLYALTAVVKDLTRAPAYTALLWTAQVLNGLCGLGVYLILDRKIGRLGALVGMVVVGLFSFQPAWYFNWGRFTQVASQALLLIAWLVSWEAISMRFGTASGKTFAGQVEKWGVVFASAGLNAGVLIYHYRVAAYYLPVLAITFLWEAYRAYRCKRALSFLSGTLILGGLAFLLILPALLDPLSAYIQRYSAPPAAAVAQAAQAAQSTGYNYFAYSPDIIFTLGMQPWLVYCAAASLIVCLALRNGFGITVALWLLSLWIEGNLYRLHIPLLEFSNFSSIVIMFYLPLSLLIGAGIHLIQMKVRFFQRPAVTNGAVAALLFAGYVFSFQRVSGVENYRQFVTTADMTAMRWIDQNLPKDAVFAVNTYFWLPNVPHGTDGGYWIPYFTGRKTTTSTMLADIGPADYARQVVQLSRLEENLAGSPGSAAVDELCQQGVDYVYVGVQGDFSRPGLNADAIRQIPTVKTVYQNKGVSIFQICAR